MTDWNQGCNLSEIWVHNLHHVSLKGFLEDPGLKIPTEMILLLSGGSTPDPVDKKRKDLRAWRLKKCSTFRKVTKCSLRWVIWHILTGSDRHAKVLKHQKSASSPHFQTVPPLPQAQVSKWEFVRYINRILAIWLMTPSYLHRLYVFSSLIISKLGWISPAGHESRIWATSDPHLELRRPRGFHVCCKMPPAIK